MGDSTTCAIDGCSNQPHLSGRGFCGGHYSRMLRDGTIPRIRPKGRLQCVYVGCDRNRVAHGWCGLHSQRIKRTGSPEPHDFQYKFWLLVDRRGPDDCWLWTGPLGHEGHAMFKYGRKSHMAYRLTYRWMVGPIPAGLEMDHLCHTWDLTCMGGNGDPHRRCVNPAHVEPVTHLVNMQRGVPARKTHCKHGHEYTAANTIRDDKGYRVCRICRDARNAARVPISKPSRPNFNGAKTHCLRGHEFTYLNTIIQVRDGKERRSCRTCVRLRLAGLTLAWRPEIRAA